MGSRSALGPAIDGNLNVIIDLSTAGEQDVSVVPGRLVAIMVDTVLSAHTVKVNDGSRLMVTLPASLAAGTNYPMHNMEFAEGLSIERTNGSATGKIVVVYQPYPEIV